jgi:hypothetical protein
VVTHGRRTEGVCGAWRFGLGCIACEWMCSGCASLHFFFCAGGTRQRLVGADIWGPSQLNSILLLTHDGPTGTRVHPPGPQHSHRLRSHCSPPMCACVQDMDVLPGCVRPCSMCVLCSSNARAAFGVLVTGHAMDVQHNKTSPRGLSVTPPCPLLWRKGH